MNPDWIEPEIEIDLLPFAWLVCLIAAGFSLMNSVSFPQMKWMN